LINKVLVVGGGSAGFLCALGLKAKMTDLDVRLIRSKDIGIIGVGEGSTMPLTNFLHGFLQIDMRWFVRQSRATWKLGMRYLNWGQNQYFYALGTQIDQRLTVLPRNSAYYCMRGMQSSTPLVALMEEGKVFQRTPAGAPAWQWNLAYHLENETFVGTLEALCRSVGVQIIDATVREVKQNDAGVSGLVMDSGQTLSADLYVDCSGFGSLLLGKTLKEPFVSFKSSLFCDRALVGGWDRTDEPIQPYTTAEAMDCGWAWRIELERRINRGYVYSSSFTADDVVEAEFRRKNPKIGPTRIVKFISGRYERGWVKNVVALGNAEGFVEPLEATALGVIAGRSRLLSEILMESGRKVPPSYVELYNKHHVKLWDSIRRYLAMHYKHNPQMHTPFWNACKNDVDLAGAEYAIEHYRQCGPSSLFGPLLIDPTDVFGPAGYLTSFIGHQIPTNSEYQPTTQEQAIWDAERQKNHAAAMHGFTVTEALAALPPPPSSAMPGMVM
jgi:tryptophan 7-halogenase